MTDRPITEVHRASAAKITDKLARLEQEKTALAKFAPLWPADRPITSLYHSTIAPAKLGEIVVQAEVETREDAIAYLDAFTLEPQVFLRGTFAGVYAKAWVPDGAFEKADTEIDCLGAYWKFSECAKLVAFTVLGDVRTAINLRIKRDPARRNIVYSGEFGGGKYIERWTLSQAPGGDQVIFASGSREYPGEVFMYFVAEPGGAAPDLKYYLLEQSRSVEWRTR